MFDVILERIKQCSQAQVSDRVHDASSESVIVKLTPQSYDGSVCQSRLQIVCVSRTYERSLVSFDAICQGLDALCDEDNEVLDISLESTVIKYDTVSGMTRILGELKCYTEVKNGGFN